MSVIGQIEVANFLNLNNAKPYEQGWCAHYPHLVLDTRGKNTIIQLSNGGGKTTITNTLFLLLTRDRSLHSRVRQIFAPKRKGLFSHVRIEVRHRDPYESIQPGMFGDIPGEPYVIGVYGFSDSNDGLNFYVYQGTLTDCPVAETTEVDGKVTIRNVKNDTFLTSLRKQRIYKNRSQEEHLSEIHMHFDAKFLNQQLQYHKLGAGDGNSNFFSTTKQRDEEFCTSFFYEHIAPEVLIDCMGQYADNDEIHFEDTLIKSAREVINIELEQIKVNEKVKRLQYTYNWLEQTEHRITGYQEQSAEMMSDVGDLWHELQFMKRCVADNPLPYIPKVISTGSDNPETISAANSLVYLNGDWLYPDFVLCGLVSALKIFHLNERAERLGIDYTKLKKTQLIEIPCDVKINTINRGHENRGYSLNNAQRIITSLDNKYFSIHNRNAVFRYLRYGYELRIKQGDVNPIRAHVQEQELKISNLKVSNKELEVTINELEHKEITLNNKVQHFDLAESAFIKMDESGLFEQNELKHPLNTKNELTLLINSLKQQLEDLVDEHTKWSRCRGDYEDVIKAFNTKKLTFMRDKFVKNKMDAQQKCEEIRKSNDNIKKLIESTIKEESDIKNQLSKILGEYEKLESFKPSYDKLMNKFEEDDVLTLRANLEDQRQDTSNTLEQLKQDIANLVQQTDKLLSLSKAYDLLIGEFGDINVLSLQERLESQRNSRSMNLEELKQNIFIETQQTKNLESLKKSHDLFKIRFEGESKASGLRLKLENQQGQNELTLKSNLDRCEIVSTNINELSKLKPSYMVAIRCYNSLDMPLENVATHLQTQKILFEGKINKNSQTLSIYRPLLNSLNEFRSHWNVDIDAAINEHKKCLLQLQTNKQKTQVQITDNNKKLLRYKNTEIAPLTLASQVLNALDFSGKKVVDVIGSSNISFERKRYLLTQFSHLLHAPVGDSYEHGLTLANQLLELDLEYPVFEFSSFREYCESNDDISFSFIIGVESLQVKAVMEPLFIKELIENTEFKLSQLNSELETINQELKIYDLEAKRYAILKQSKTAISDEIEFKYSEITAKLEEAKTNMQKLEVLIESPAFNELEQACNYLRYGGDQAAAQNQKEINELKIKIQKTKSNKKKLSLLLTEELITVLNKAESFEMEGGGDALNQSTEKLIHYQEQLQSLETLKKEAERLCNEYIPYIKSAKRFEIEGGYDTLNKLVSKLESEKQQIQPCERKKLNAEKLCNEYIPYIKQAENFIRMGSISAFLSLKEQVDDLQQNEKSKRDHLYKLRIDANKLSMRLESINSELMDANTIHDTWISPLNRAISYQSDGGLEFDLTYIEKLNNLKSLHDISSEKIAFQFEEAQNYIDAIEKNIDRQQLIAEFNSVKKLLSGNRIKVKDNSQDIEEIRIVINDMSNNIYEFDLSIKTIIAKYLEAASLLSFIQDEFKLEKIQSDISANLKFAEDSECEIRNLNSDSLSNIQESYLNIADIIQRLSFSEKRKDISNKKRDVKWTLDTLLSNIRENKDSDIGLREEERKELSIDNHRQLFHHVKNYRLCFEKLSLDANKICEKLNQDVDNQHKNLSSSMSLLTSQLQGNFDLLRKELMPGRSKAGFYVEADIIEKDKISERLKKLIDSIRQREVDRKKSKEMSENSGMIIESDNKYLKQLKEHIRDNFYRTVFKGKDERSAPMIYFSHPSLAKGVRKKLSKEYSTGEKTALSLLLLTKLAQVSSVRSQRIGLGSVHRNSRRKDSANKVVIIDGLFSNLSEPRLIRFSLDTVRLMNDHFQLIGWVHSPEYKNDFEIFPTLYSVQRVNSLGYVTLEDKSEKLIPSRMASGLMYVDKLNDRVQ
ncbi:hypothetical protein [Pseudoalteromonas denitrificans]|uniref:DNA repair exonuclease SbcCD ATPase subunit n=1 Tax=Pseudoalteromonas denitrificans DSM 6059 TaxID=1123010 RepID=A0A1I1JGB8_9GAMM|nr:hypothetical protein [Pseudoalteromonas denitrificans]SFC47587.1 DNA repair exonuclease SbcCD ATPase subunit [Pseudoalteromonas denitrificans DSM 6059]